MSRQTSRGEAPVAVVCEAFGISRVAWYAARKPVAPTLASPRPPRARGGAGELLVAIEAIVAEHRAWGVRTVWAMLKRSDFRVGRRPVWALMKAPGHVLSGGPPREATRRRGQVVVPEPNRCLATEFTTVWTAEDGLVAVAVTIDCG